MSAPKAYFENIDNVFHCLSDVIDLLLEYGVCVVRGVEIDADTQGILMRSIGDILGWYPNSDGGSLNLYLENHEFTIKQKTIQFNDDVSKINYKDEVLVSWHMEHIGFLNPAVGATWNMKKFLCDRECGKTLFFDGTQIKQLINQKEFEFLEKCEFLVDFNDNNQEYEKFGVLPEGVVRVPAVKLHKYSGKQIVNIPPSLGQNSKLISFDKIEPTYENIMEFNSLVLKISRLIMHSEKNRITHRWKQNDLVIADLSRMYHAVTGGFSANERFFEGMWAYGNPGTKISITNI